MHPETGNRWPSTNTLFLGKKVERASLLCLQTPRKQKRKTSVLNNAVVLKHLFFSPKQCLFYFLGPFSFKFYILATGTVKNKSYTGEDPCELCWACVGKSRQCGGVVFHSICVNALSTYIMFICMSISLHLVVFVCYHSTFKPHYRDKRIKDFYGGSICTKRGTSHTSLTALTMAIILFTILYYTASKLHHCFFFMIH